MKTNFDFTVGDSLTLPDGEEVQIVTMTAGEGPMPSYQVRFKLSGEVKTLTEDEVHALRDG